jgi:hypothetical protein
MQLRPASAGDEVTTLERFELRVVRIPDHTGDHAGAISKFQQDVLSTLPVNPELLVDHLEGLVNRLALGESIDRSPCHSKDPREMDQTWPENRSRPPQILNLGGLSRAF